MQSNVERLDRNCVSIEVGLDPAEVEKALGEAYLRVARRAKVPGFRKGRVPRPILEAHYGKEILYEDAVDILVPSAYRDALRQHSLEPIDQPEMSVVEPLEQGKTFVFKAKVQVLPEVHLGKYLGVQAEKPKAAVAEVDVQKRLEDLREQYAELVLADHDGLAMGDFAVIDFDGYINGLPFQGGSAKGYTFEVTEGSHLPGFAEGLQGMRAGETREIPVHFPTGYQTTDLAGKEAMFRVTLHEIKVKERPGLNEDFAKSLGHDSVEALTDALRSGLQAAAEREAERIFGERVLTVAVGDAQVEIPAILVAREVEHRYETLSRNLGYRGLMIENYLANLGKTEDEVKQEMRADAEVEVRRELVIQAVRKAEGIEPTEEEIAEKINELAGLYRAKDPAEFRRKLEKSGRIEALQESLAGEKAVKFMVEKAEALSERKSKKG